MYGLIEFHYQNYIPLAELTWTQNKVAYAQMHGYKTFCKNSGFKEDSKIGFQKLWAVKEIMEENRDVSWFWVTGTDSMITNFFTRIEDRINNNYHFIISVDVNGLNADSFLVRNTVEGRSLIDKMLAVEEECSKHWDIEQRAMAVVMGLPVTADPTWKTMNYNIQLNEETKDIVKIMPQRYMNSFNYQLYHYTDHRDTVGWNGNWQLGDWLIHWPATSLDQRIHLYSFYNQHIVK
jgi:hypothetical protein